PALSPFVPRPHPPPRNRPSFPTRRSSDLVRQPDLGSGNGDPAHLLVLWFPAARRCQAAPQLHRDLLGSGAGWRSDGEFLELGHLDPQSTRLHSSHGSLSLAVSSFHGDLAD